MGMSNNYLMHGGDYNPDQWLHMPEVLKTDIERFKEAKINTVSVGIFAWSKLEPREGEYEFDWLEKVIDDLYENGISVILATPSGARPHWMTDKYPEVLRTDAEGRKMIFGGRHNHCLTSPVYREKVRQMNTALAKRFGGHPAVKMWHISNEYGGECHCQLCQNAFRQWLERKYKTIDALNDSWWTAFWSHTYDSFSQVESPSPIGETSVHGLTLDWKRFVSDQTIDFMEQEIAAIREAGSDKPVTANLMYHFEGIDYFRMARKMDIASWDSYPTWHQDPESVTAAETGFWHDVIRSLKRKPFLLMESCPGATNWQPVSKLRRPGMVRAASLQAIAHGGDGALYFQMRKSRGASEKFHGAVLDHYDGNDTRTFRDVCEDGDMLEALGEVSGAETRAKAAVLYDWDNLWAMREAAGPRNAGLHEDECIEKSWRALRKLGLDVDVIDQRTSFDRYKFIAAPMQYLFHPGFSQKVRSFVENGGTFVMTYWSGVVDENDRCFLGGRPYDLMDVFGLRAEEIDGLYDWEENSICQPVSGAKFEGMRESYNCKYLCELVKPAAAETLMVYGSDFYAGQPALLRNSYGEGTAYYVCADAEQSFYDDLYRRLTAQAGLESLMEGEIPEGVEVTSRENETAKYIFIQNFNREAVSLALPEGTVIYGNEGGEIEALGGVVVRIEK